MIPTYKRKTSFNASSPPPSKKSPFSPDTSPPPPPKTFGRPMTTAAAAAAAIKRSSMPPHRRQSSSSNVTPSRQGSVETEREDSVTREEEKQTQKDTTIDAEVEDDEKEEVVVDMDTHMQAQMEKQKEDMKILLENFSPEQLQRYEAYRRSALNRTNVKRLVSQVLNQQCSQTMAFVVAGFAKVYVGEIIEKARDVMEEWNDTGPIRPEHLREAHRRYLKESSFATLGRKF
ncbi:hypothetical protein G6F70_002422 [Rhizopus microsporus]|uniref:Transcription initiation factor TFIID subunit 11 n=2 Tax=Rhizopus TaxID=4842 RepID=A0A367JUP6_RHIAZ|nr:hypothetical protein G6F71_006186 [Rhizopus microsporus]RCH93647.1 transcription initiation factor TFIID subunit 11 [Rhizopus azygosporus]KAG1202276.1 hypothetical protein G6F70_002422 [Rhizopus microsporus]KAG1209744.1 hypothetical protein G6F69_006085 [Rhizopus microsporus]KAG1231166.1 hypothetical protein G6F67_005947 [Rhizopus microsporus]